MVGVVNWTALRDEVDAARVRLRDGRSPTEREHVPSLVVGEDHRIALHPGVDPTCAVPRSVANLRPPTTRRRFHGGYAVGEGAYGPVRKELAEKGEEIILAILVTGHVPSDELPALYLSIGYYGWGMNGFAQACRRLCIDPESCSLQESASVIARLKVSGAEKLHRREATPDNSKVRIPHRAAQAS